VIATIDWDTIWTGRAALPVLALASLAAGLLLAAANDLSARSVPNRVPATLWTLALLAALVPPGTPRVTELLRLLAATCVALALWLPLWLIGRIGGADVKMFAAAGAWIGVRGVFEAALLTAICGGLLAVVLLVIGRYRRSSLSGDVPYVVAMVPAFLLVGTGWRLFR
jgi:prepilin peptidase CpaA